MSKWDHFDLWLRIWGSINASTLVFAITWTPAHTTLQHVADGILDADVHFLNDGADDLAKIGARAHSVSAVTAAAARSRVNSTRVIQRMGAWIMAVRYMSLSLKGRAAGFSEHELGIRYKWLMALVNSQSPKAASILADQSAPFGSVDFEHPARPASVVPCTTGSVFSLELAGSTAAHRADNSLLTSHSPFAALDEEEDDVFGHGQSGFDDNPTPSSYLQRLPTPSTMSTSTTTTVQPSYDDDEDVFGHGLDGFDDPTPWPSAADLAPAAAVDGAAAASHGADPPDPLSLALDLLEARFDAIDQSLLAAASQAENSGNATLTSAEVAGPN